MDLVNQLSEETIFHMGQNNNINERSTDNKFKNNDNDNTYFCAKCLKELDSEDRDVVKDVEGNYFCGRFCRQEYRRENTKLIEEVIGGF